MFGRDYAEGALMVFTRRWTEAAAAKKEQDLKQGGTHSTEQRPAAAVEKPKYPEPQRT